MAVQVMSRFAPNAHVEVSHSDRLLYRRFTTVAVALCSDELPEGRWPM